MSTDFSTRKLRRLTQVMLLFFLVIAIRVWHLEVVQRDEKARLSRLPRQRTIVQKANRGVLFDRFGEPLAINRICYNATIYYNQIAQIPARGWVAETKTRCYPRREYIRKLAHELAPILALDPQRIEDLIVSKASLFPHAPFLLHGGLTEAQHYQLALLEKDHPCLHAEIAPERFYPHGKAACGIIGSMGSISQKKYFAIADEIHALQQILDETHLGLEPEFPNPSDTVETLEERLQFLKEKAYTLQDLVGKTGIEAQAETALRGSYGKKVFEVDQKGKIVGELENIPAVAGQPQHLSVSIELQEFAEGLLAQDEIFREKKVPKQPWIKGGSIVAMNPRTGEVLALASTPRFDPNDFIRSAEPVAAAQKQQNLCRWLENEKHIAALWDGKEPLRREKFSVNKGFTEESVMLSWDVFLSFVLPEDSPLKTETVKAAVQNPHSDLCRLVVHAPLFNDTALKVLGKYTLSEYRALNQAVCRLEEKLKTARKKTFHANDFVAWKQEHPDEFKNARRPYLDLLDLKEKKLFAAAWETERLDALASAVLDDPECSVLAQNRLEDTKAVLRTFRSYADLGEQKPLAASFYPKEGLGYGRSYGFQVGIPQGSVFKLVTAYAGLMATNGVNPLTMVDEWQANNGVGTTLGGALYPRIYKGGRLPKSASAHVGQIDIFGAIERSSNPYFSLIAGDILHHPEDLNAAARMFGFGEKTGLELPGEMSGCLPTDLTQNKTGLYSAAIGQHTLLTTPLQAAVMLSTIANEGHVLKPQILKQGTPEILRTIELPAKIRGFLLEGMDRVLWSEKGNSRAEICRHLRVYPEWHKRFMELEHRVVGKSGTAEVMYTFYPGEKASMTKHVWFGAISFPEGREKAPDLVVVVCLRFGDAGREAAPLATEVIAKWHEIVRKKM